MRACWIIPAAWPWLDAHRQPGLGWIHTGGLALVGCTGAISQCFFIVYDFEYVKKP
jgi:hypothetical protein